jgi:prepilin-type processing-associated H-X9-DG protein
MFSETTRGVRIAGDFRNVPYVSTGTFDLQNLTTAMYSACQASTTSITYRGLEYYRPITMTANYAHTISPNYQGMDCGWGNFFVAHQAARSYHSGGVNAVMVDGSVHFFKNTINLTTWKAVGTISGGEVLSADQY